MSWTLNNTRIYVSTHDSKAEQVIARLQPIAGATILHNFGYTTETIGLNALVAGETDLTAIKNLRTTGLSYTLSGPEGIIGNYFVKDVSAKRTPSTCIILFDRPSLPTDTPIYKVDLQLYEDA